jgi:hypothetical protein
MKTAICFVALARLAATYFYVRFPLVDLRAPRIWTFLIGLDEH